MLVKGGPGVSALAVKFSKESCTKCRCQLDKNSSACLLLYPDSNVGWPDIGLISLLLFWHWASIGPMHNAVWATTKCWASWNMWAFNSLGPSDAIWHWRSWSTLVQVMACCLTAPSHYLNHCWLIIIMVQWCSCEGNFAWDIMAISH